MLSDLVAVNLIEIKSFTIRDKRVNTCKRINLVIYDNVCVFSHVYETPKKIQNVHMTIYTNYNYRALV